MKTTIAEEYHNLVIVVGKGRLRVKAGYIGPDPDAELVVYH